MRFDVVTVFPELFEPFFRQGVVGRALGRGLLQLQAHDLRAFTSDTHRQVDDEPFGGGPGMVLKPEPFFAALESIRPHNRGPVILLEPWGEPLTQALAAELALEPGLIILCGRYEGVDDRVREALADREVSIGDYVLSGGELPALVLIDAVGRLVPGVVGDQDSLQHDLFAGGGYPQFTRPAEYRGLKVPPVLTSGNHEKIEQWRREQAGRRARRKARSEA